MLVIAAIVLGIWYLPRLWQKVGGPALAVKLAGVLRTLWKVALAVGAVAVVAAMAQGCDGEDPTPDGSGASGGSGGSDAGPCIAYEPENCPPPGSGTPTTTAGGILLGDDADGPDYAPCPAFHEEDCPLETGP